uniref:Secreted protein n=1 Tax=Panagrellus redivivus TaxID=6233 RepID=A0A7E4V506_PANRE
MFYQALFLIVLIGSTHAAKHGYGPDIREVHKQAPPRRLSAPPVKIDAGYLNMEKWQKNQNPEAGKYITPP